MATSPADENLATALKDALGKDPRGIIEYRGKPVTAITIALRGAGDGLSKAMEIDPEVIEIGDEIALLIHGRVRAHLITEIDKADSYELKLDIKAGTAMIDDRSGSMAKLRKMQDEIAKRVEDVKGVQRLEGTDAKDLEGDEDGDEKKSALYAVGDSEDGDEG